MASNPGVQPSTPYESKPPEWLPKATRDGDLGYHGFHPPKPGQEEEILSETNIKYGYTEPLLFGTELWPGTDTFISAFRQDSKDGLNSLQELMEKVVARRSELYAVGENTPFKLPSRMTFGGDKKTQWYEKLADPNIPLHEITQVSHGTKNADGIETLYVNKLPVDRAFWYIRALGAIEIQAKNKSGSGAQHSVIPEWTTALTSYLKRQLGEIAMPAISRTGANIKQVFKRTKLSDAEGREAWVDKFAYTLELLRCFSDCGLLDQSSFLTWLVTTAGVSEGLGPHQFIFVVRIVDEHFDLVACNRAFATPIIEACLARYLEVQSSPGRQHASYILNEISSLTLRFFRYNEDLFVNRNIVMNHPSHMQDLLLQAIQQLDPDVQSKIKEDTMARYHHLMECLGSIFSVQLPADEDTVEVKSRLTDIDLLNTIDTTTDLASFQFLPPPATPSSTPSDSRPFVIRLSILLTWAVTPGQAGDPGVRPYIATALISMWKAQALRSIPNANQFLQRQLLSWLEEKDLLRPYMHQSSMVPPLKALFWRRGAKANGELEAIALLFGDLVHRRLFSFSDYLTRMTSFGQGSAPSPTKTDINIEGGSPKPPTIAHPDHLELLRQLPLWDKISEQLLNQRKIVLYGIRARKTTEDAMEKEIRAEIRRVVPLFFNGPQVQETFSRALLPQTLAAGKFVQARVIHHWLFDLVKDYISRTSASSALAQVSVLPLPVYNTLTRIFSWTGCFISLFELNNLMLHHALDDQVLMFTIRSIVRHHEIWVSTMRVERVAEILLETYRRLKEQNRKSPKPILVTLRGLDQFSMLPPHLKESIQAELNETRKLLLSDSYSSSPAPPILPFIRAALEENSLEQPTDVATTMWYKNHAHADWGTVSWQAVVSALNSRTWDPSIPDHTMAERFTSLVSCIDAHLPDGIKDVVRIWFETAGAERMMEVADEEWHMMEHMTLALSSNGVLSPEAVLNGLVFPVWNHAYLPQGATDYSQSLARTLSLASAILLCEPMRHEEGKMTEVEIKLDASRTRATHPWNFTPILRGIHALAVFEQDEALEPILKDQIRILRRRLLQDTFMQNQIFSRTLLLQKVFDVIASENPGRRTILIANLQECLRNEWDVANFPITAARWARALNTIDFWSFPSAKLTLRLFLEQLHQKSLEEQSGSRGDLPLDDGYLESLASALSEGRLSSSGIALTAELARGSEAALHDKIARHGLEQLSLCLASSDSDDPVAFVTTAKELLRLIITFRRTESSSHPFVWATGLQDQFLRNWMCKVSTLQECVRGTRTEMRDYDLQEIADVICFMMRILHFFSELFGPDLGPKIVPAVSSIVQLAVMFGGSIALDEITFSMLIDTACILMDDCSREVKQQISARLGQAAIVGLPAHLPSPSRYRMESILPFNPHDKTVSNLGQAQRINGDLEFTSAVRNQSWEWMDSVEAVEPSTVLNTRVRNTAAMRLELFETSSKGESILTDKRVGETMKQGGDLWMLRDSAASEGLLARAWRESRTAAWDVKSVDESMTSGSRALSPAASRSSAHMSTSSRRGSPSINLRGHPTSIPTVETVDAEPLVEHKPARALKRKARIDEDDNAEPDIVMTGERRAAIKTTQSKRGKGKGKSKR